MRKSCAAKADSCNGSAKVPVTRCMVGAVSIGLGLAAAGTGASRSGSSLRWASAARSRGMLAAGCAVILDAHCGPTAGATELLCSDWWTGLNHPNGVKLIGNSMFDGVLIGNSITVINYGDCFTAHFYA